MLVSDVELLLQESAIEPTVERSGTSIPNRHVVVDGSKVCDCLPGRQIGGGFHRIMRSHLAKEDHHYTQICQTRRDSQARLGRGGPEPAKAISRNSVEVAKLSSDYETAVCLQGQ